jgi:biopolymer transport protein ExbB
MKHIIHHTLLAVALCAPAAIGQSQEAEAIGGAALEAEAPVESAAPGKTQAATLGDAAETAAARLEQSVAALNALREEIEQEKLPLTIRLNQLENELTAVRQEYGSVSRVLELRTLDLSSLQRDIERAENEETYLSTLFGQFVTNFGPRLHIAETQRYAQKLDAALAAPENANLTALQVFQAQIALLGTALDRLEDGLGGTRFDGTAVDASRVQKPGSFLLLGPAAFFLSDDGAALGTAEQRLGSLEPNVIPYSAPEQAEALRAVMLTGQGTLPFDPTLGNAHRVEEATQETLLEHIQKGGPVMYPILTLAALALLVALFKWIGLSTNRKPSKKRVESLLEAVENRDEEAARKQASKIKGPAGRMLRAGVAHLHEPRELVEEVLFEHSLKARLKLERFLPFIAICAAASPLLGLLGTVTGIIETFKMLTISESGDVKSLSGGISKALITTEFGLIVAIPSLLLHAFLARKAKGILNQMDTVAVAFVNQLSKTPFRPKHRADGAESTETPAGSSAAPDRDVVKAQVSEILHELLGPLVAEANGANRAGAVPETTKAS